MPFTTSPGGPVGYTKAAPTQKHNLLRSLRGKRRDNGVVDDAEFAHETRMVDDDLSEISVPSIVPMTPEKPGPASGSRTTIGDAVRRLK